jgi:hypothetical protein
MIKNEKCGAGDGNRTHVASLEGWSFTIKLHPRMVEGAGFEPAKAMLADLQSATFNHSVTLPSFIKTS